ncbi:MAG: Lecithin:cholesterol acyltransferase [Microgenomates group bacterium ADurb.Bin219]|nr:MAG: Lecithin:cholesterol acyltransferase [Microgenomates group bacterium ADurb.Bin219]
MKKKILFILSLITFFVSSKKILFAYSFTDNFEDGNLDGWVRVDDPDRTPCSAQWIVNSDKMLGIQVLNQYQCTTNIVPNDYLWGSIGNNYTFEFDMKFVRGTDHNVAFRFSPSSPSNNWYDLHFQCPGDFIIERLNPNGEYNKNIVGSYQNGQTYHIKIVIFYNNIKVYVENVLVKDYTSYVDIFPSGKIALRATTGSDPISETWFDNIVVTSIDEEIPTPTPTSTPTPIPTQTPTLIPTPTLTPMPSSKIPIVVIPGHGACYNHEAIIDGKENVPQEEWGLWSFVHDYDGLLKSIENSGYEENKDLFLFCYDWRKKIDQTADVLNDFIVNKVLKDRTDVDRIKIVGHSLGGLVGRSFAQKYQGAFLEKLITVGSPHSGVPQVYYAWEGGEPPGEKNLGWLAWQILIQTQKRNFATNVETIRNIAPSTLDLFPTYNFLVNQDYSEKVFQDMNWFNNWLNNLNNSLPGSELLAKIKAISGQGIDTPRGYWIEERSWLDALLGKWQDGKPTEPIHANGDSTVWEDSSRIPGENPEVLSLNHGNLVKKEAGIRKILQMLEIPENENVIEESQTLLAFPSLLFILGSPGSITVTDPNGFSYSGGAEKMVFLSPVVSGNYQININPIINGSYKLFVGQETDESSHWLTLDGELTVLPISIQFNFNKYHPKKSTFLDPSGNLYLNLAKDKLNLLKKQSKNNFLNNILKKIDFTKKLIESQRYLEASNSIEVIIKEFFTLRASNSSSLVRNISFEAIEFLVKSYEIVSAGLKYSPSGKSIEAEISNLEKFFKLTESKLAFFQKIKIIKETNGVSFELAQINFLKAKEAFSQNNLYLSRILISVTQSLLQESLKIK